MRTDGTVVQRVASAMSLPLACAFGPNNEIYVSDLESGNIYKIPTPYGVQVGAPFASGFNGPSGLAFGPNDDLYVAEYNGKKIKRINIQTGAVSLVSSSSELNNPHGIAFSPDGLLYVANTTGHNVLVIDPKTGTVTNRLIGGDAGFHECDHSERNRPGLRRSENTSGCDGLETEPFGCYGRASGRRNCQPWCPAT